VCGNNIGLKYGVNAVEGENSLGKSSSVASRCPSLHHRVWMVLVQLSAVQFAMHLYPSEGTASINLSEMPKHILVQTYK
jgi:hypothetical protein